MGIFYSFWKSKRFNSYALQCQSFFNHFDYLGVPNLYFAIGSPILTNFSCIFLYKGSYFIKPCILFTFKNMNLLAQSFLKNQFIVWIFKKMIVLRKQKICFPNFTRYFSNNTFNKTWNTKWSQNIAYVSIRIGLYHHHIKKI